MRIRTSGDQLWYFRMTLNYIHFLITGLSFENHGINIQGVFFSSANTNITVTRKVINRILIGLKRFEAEIWRYRFVKLDQNLVKNLKCLFYHFPPLTSILEFEKFALHKME